MLYLRALHIIFIVTWFAGLFYIVRLFVYHAESLLKTEPDRRILTEHFRIAERRLWYGITWPSAVMTLIFGVCLLINMYGSGIPDWLWVKLVFVLLLFAYQIACHRLFLKFQKEENPGITSMQMRLWNEVATIFLVAIVFIVVLKDVMNWLYGLAGFLILAIVLLIAIKIYKKLRRE